MAKKPTITSITSGYASTNTLNDNFTALRDAFDNTLSLDGSTPNSMTSDLNLNNNDILNASRILVGGVDYIATALSYKNDAETAKTAAEAAQAAAELVYDNFDDRYLGSKASDPTVDNDGNALLDGALYYDTINTVMKFYDTSTSTWYRTTPTTSDQANIDIVAGNTTNINTVAGISANVTTVAGISSDVTTVAADGTDIGTVATSISNVNTAATNISNINTVAGISANVTTVAGNTTNINTVAGNNSNITTVAGISSDVTTVAGQTTNLQNVTDNLTAIQNAATNATNAANSASAAATSAAAAAASADFFDDVYLGSKASDPATDNDGDALNAGDLYFNTTSNNLKVYSGSAWQDAAVDSSSFVQKGGDTLTGNLSFDTNKALFGSRSNLEIYHSSTPVTASNLTIYFTNGSTSGTMVITDSDHSISVSDTVRVDSPEILNWSVLDIVGVDKSALQQDLTVSAVTSTTFTVPVTYASDPGTTGTLSQAGTYYYYTGSASSYISDQGAGSLNILGSEINIFNDAETAQLAQFNTTATKLFHNNSEKLATTSTGIDVTGTVTADGLTVSGNIKTTSDNTIIAPYGSLLGFVKKSGSAGSVAYASGQSLIFTQSSASSLSDASAETYTERMRIDSSGNLLLGTSAHAGYGPLQVGSTSTASTIIQMLAATNGYNTIHFGDATSGTGRYAGFVQYNHTDDKLFLGAGGATRATITSAGNVGIGTASPNSPLEVSNGTENHRVAFGTGEVYLMARNASSYITQEYIANQHVFTGYGDNSSNEAARIDASGNLLVGRTSSSGFTTSSGSAHFPNGSIFATVDGGQALNVSRLTSDGDIAGFYKDGTKVGSIGVSADGASFGNATQHIAMHSNVLFPSSTTHSYLDATIDLGASSGRFKDLYLSGTINKTAGSGTFAIETSGSSSVNLNASNSMKFTVGNTDSHQFINGTTTAMTLDSSGNLLVGKTTLDYEGTAGLILRNDGLINAARSGGNVTDFNRLSSDGEVVRISKDGSTVGSIGSFASGTRLYFAGGSSALTVATNEVYPASNTGAGADGTMDMGSSGARFKDLYLSGGVYLGGTGAANKLDDYEEGLHVVTMTGSTSGTATLNSALDTITYRKIGSVVHVQGRIQLSSVNGASGRVKISLPFSAASLTEDGTALLTAVVYSGNKIDSGEGTIIWEIFESQNVANLYYSDGATVADVSFTTHVDNDTVVGISGSYISA